MQVLLRMILSLRHRCLHIHTYIVVVSSGTYAMWEQLSFCLFLPMLLHLVLLLLLLLV